jgi:hypothetical protein
MITVQVYHTSHRNQCFDDDSRIFQPQQKPNPIGLGLVFTPPHPSQSPAARSGRRQRVGWVESRGETHQSWWRGRRVSRSRLTRPTELGDPSGLAGEGVEFPPDVRVPDLERFVPTGGDYPGTVRAEAGRMDRTGVVEDVA